MTILTIKGADKTSSILLDKGLKDIKPLCANSSKTVILTDRNVYGYYKDYFLLVLKLLL